MDPVRNPNRGHTGGVLVDSHGGERASGFEIRRLPVQDDRGPINRQENSQVFENGALYDLTQ
jgi:hypothetical protein